MNHNLQLALNNPTISQESKENLTQLVNFFESKSLTQSDKEYIKYHFNSICERDTAANKSFAVSELQKELTK